MNSTRSPTLNDIFVTVVLLYVNLRFCFPGVPVVSLQHNTYEVVYGDNFTINCTVDAQPPASNVYWIKSDDHQISNINSGLPGTKGITVDIPSLTIMFATESDAGLYKCYAENEKGTGSSQTVPVKIVGGLPNIIINVKNYTVLYGETIALNCSIDANPPVIEVHWTRNSSGVVTLLSSGSVGVRGINQTNPSLILNNVVSSDSGTYVCIASNIAGTQHSNEITLNVYGDIPNVTVNQTLYRVAFGQSIILHCEITAEPPLTHVYWERLVENKRHIVYPGKSGTSDEKLTNPSLIIQYTTLIDAGYYICLGKNLAGTANGSLINLDVTGDAPIVTVGSPSYSSTFGTNISLECFVSSNPKAILVYWEKESNGVMTTINANAIGMSGSTDVMPSLTLQSTYMSDSGIYTCFAVNELGTSLSNTTRLTVTGGKPIVTVDPYNKTVDYGSRLTLSCRVIASPKQTAVYWQKALNSTIVSLFAGLPGVLGVTVDDPSLTLEYVTREDIGVYTCVAENVIGKGYSNDSFNLDLIADVPEITVDRLNYTAYDGKSIQLKCIVHSNPTHKNVFWERTNNGTTTTILSGMIGIRGVNNESPSLTIEFVTLEMAGEYRCYATNEIGTGASKTIELIVLT